MTITAASIDASGNYLFVTGTWAASTGAAALYPYSDFNLDPDGAKNLQLTIQRAGFIRSGGQASAATRVKVCTALKMVRKPVQYDPPTSQFTVPTFDSLFNPANIPLDEVDNGTTRTVKILLASRAYAGETVVLNALAGWRTGEGATSGLSVDTSAVTAAHPKVVSRAATPALQVVAGTFRFDTATVGHYPEGFEGVCAVKFSITDSAGTTTTPVWITGATVSSIHGDNFKCWGATLDPTGLATGPININWTVYPWTGAARNFSTAGSATAPGTLGFSTVCEAGTPFLYDPAGTRYPAAFIDIDPIAGTATPPTTQANALLVVKSTSAAAQAVTPSLKPIDWSTACQFLKVAARTTGSNTFSFDGATIIIPAAVAITGYVSGTVLTVVTATGRNIAVGDTVLCPAVSAGIPAGTTVTSLGTGTGGAGTYNISASATAGSSGSPVAMTVGGVVFGTTSVGTGANNYETWLNTIGDPTLTVAQRRARCLFIANVSVSPPGTRAAFFHWQNMGLVATNKPFNSLYNWIDNVDITSQTPTATNAPIFGAAALGVAKAFLTNVKMYGHGVGITGVGGAVKLARNVQLDLSTCGITLINVTKTYNPSVAVGSRPAITFKYPLNDPDAMADTIRWNIDGRGMDSGSYDLSIYDPGDGTKLQLIRQMNVNVLLEMTNGNLTVIRSTDGTSINELDCLWEGCTLVGDRTILNYDEPPCASSSMTASIASNVLTVTAVSNQTGTGTTTFGITPGSSLVGTGVTAGTTIVSQASGTTGGVGTYNVTTTPDVASRAMTSGNLNDVATKTNTANGIVLRNFYHDKFFAKTDVFQATTIGGSPYTGVRVKATGTNLEGYVKGRTGSWPFLMGADQINVIDGWRFSGGANSGGCQEGHGLNAKINPNNNSGGGNSVATLTYPKFMNDASWFGTKSMFGDYRPAAGSPLRNMATDANTDLDLAGVQRGTTFAAGALEGLPVFAAAVRRPFVGGRVGL